VILSSNEARAAFRRQSSRRVANNVEEMQATMCYLNTKQLDGESNLKQIEAIRAIDNLFQDPSIDVSQRNKVL